MSEALVKYEKLQQVLMHGNIAKLTGEEKLDYYNRVCDTLGLNPLTKPFEFISFQGKEVMYATKNCGEQLRARDKISIRIVSREIQEDLYVVTARAINAEGREDESIAAIPLTTTKVDQRTGAVSVAPLQGMDRANAVMKCETKAKRRVTLSICGLGMLDETEVEDVPNSIKVVRVETPKELKEGKQEENLPSPTLRSIMTKYIALYKLDKEAERDVLMGIYNNASKCLDLESSENYIKGAFTEVYSEKSSD
jgi:hypothetical protein